MAAASTKSTIDPYEYMDGKSIDAELKCTICTQPFQQPVCLTCQHTFCRECIESWLNDHHSCPTCRRSPLPFVDDKKYSPVNTHIVNNQLDRLLVRCNHCDEINIQRGNFPEHEEKCPKSMSHCLSADIACTWRGPRTQLETHLAECSFQQIRPIINRFQSQLDASLEVQHDLQEKLEQQSEDLNFLLAFINEGNPMHKDCVKPYSRCQYAIRRQGKSKTVFLCSLCENTVRRRHVSLHACSLNEMIECICQTCYERQYPIAEDGDYEYEYEDDDHQ